MSSHQHETTTKPTGAKPYQRSVAVAAPMLDMDLLTPAYQNPAQARLMPRMVGQLQRQLGNQATVSLLNRVDRSLQRCGCGAQVQASADACPACGVQRTSFGGLIQRRCTPDAECAAVEESPDREAEESELDQEERRDRRRERQSESRQTERGHRGPARQIEQFLSTEAPGLLAEIHGIYLDMDMGDITTAWSDPCDTDAIVPPIEGAPGGSWCVFVRGPLNQQAYQFNNDPDAEMIGGVPRDIWRVRAIQLMTHEADHARRSRIVDQARAFTLSNPAPLSAECHTQETSDQLSEIRSLISEFPTVFREIPPGASHEHPMWREMERWFSNILRDGGATVKGKMDEMGCNCECTEIDLLIRDSFDDLTTLRRWTQEEKDFFHRVLNMPEWGIRWPFPAP